MLDSPSERHDEARLLPMRSLESGDFVTTDGRGNDLEAGPSERPRSRVEAPLSHSTVDRRPSYPYSRRRFHDGDEIELPVLRNNESGHASAADENQALSTSPVLFDSHLGPSSLEDDKTSPKGGKWNQVKSHVPRRVRKRIPKLPWRCSVSDDQGEWLREEDLVTEWMALFFDLAVVAVLSVFSNEHEMADGSDIPVYFSYYVVIIWFWTTQIHYDILYEGEDLFHRYCKLLQILLFCFVGASSSGWDLGLLQSAVGPEQGDYVERVAAEKAFLAVAISVAIYRGLLAVQYFYVAHDGRRAGRKVSGLVTAGTSLVLSCILCIVSAAVPNETKGGAIVKITFFYLAPAVEIVCIAIQILLGIHGPARPTAIAQRYAAFTLVILGEGFIRLIQTMTKILGSPSTNNTSLYTQVFLAIVTLYNFWVLLFSHFRWWDTIDARLSALWEFVHFPLHFSLLLFLSAVKNTVSTAGMLRATDDALTWMDEVVSAALDGVELPTANFSRIERHLGKLHPLPTFQEEYKYLLSLSNASSIDANATIWVEAAKYWGQILVLTSDTLGMKTGDGVYNSYIELSSISGTTGDTLGFLKALALFVTLNENMYADALRGTQWIFPTAGGALFCFGLRSMVRYKFGGWSNAIIHGGLLFFGLALALLGLLDLGTQNLPLFSIVDSLSDSNGTMPENHTITSNTSGVLSNGSIVVNGTVADFDMGKGIPVNLMYELVVENWALAIIMAVSSLVTWIPPVILRIVHHYRGGVYREHTA